MKENMLALLNAKFSGTRKDVLEQLARILSLQIASEDDAKALVEKMTEAQVRDFGKEFRAMVDKEVSDGTKTFEANLRKKYDLVEKQVESGNQQQETNKPIDRNDIAAIVQDAIAKATKPLQEKLNAFEQNNVSKNRLQSLTEKLNECKDESFKAQTLKDFHRMTFRDDADFGEYLETKVKDIATANQSVADAALSGAAGNPYFSQKDESGVSKGVAAYISAQKNDADGCIGKQI